MTLPLLLLLLLLIIMIIKAHGRRLGQRAILYNNVIGAYAIHRLWRQAILLLLSLVVSLSLLYFYYCYYLYSYYNLAAGLHNDDNINDTNTYINNT